MNGQTPETREGAQTKILASGIEIQRDARRNILIYSAEIIREQLYGHPLFYDHNVSVGRKNPRIYVAFSLYGVCDLSESGRRAREKMYKLEEKLFRLDGLDRHLSREEEITYLNLESELEELSEGYYTRESTLRREAFEFLDRIAVSELRLKKFLLNSFSINLLSKKGSFSFDYVKAYGLNQKYL